MRIRTALPKDNEQLVALARLTPMHATITICMERDPNFFSLIHRKGTAEVLVAEEDDCIIGCVSIVKENMILLEEPVTVHYACDLKVHPNHRGKKIGTMLSEAMKEYMVSHGADLVFCTMADGNSKVTPIIFGRGGVEGSMRLGAFYILQLLPKKNFISPTNVEFKTLDDDQFMLEFYKEFSKRYALSPLLDADTFFGCNHFEARVNNDAVAMISLFDPIDLKQHVLVDYPWYYQLFISFLKMARPLLHTPYLPKKGEQIRILYIKGFACLPGHEETLFSLIEYAMQYAYRLNYSFLSIAMHEADPLRVRMKKFISFPFKAQVIFSSFKREFGRLEKISASNLTLDFSLI